MSLRSRRIALIFSRSFSLGQPSSLARSTASQKMPAYVCLPHHLGWAEGGRRPGIYGGFLGQRSDPLCAECNAYHDPGADLKNRARPPEQPVLGLVHLAHRALSEEPEQAILVDLPRVEGGAPEGDKIYLPPQPGFEEPAAYRNDKPGDLIPFAKSIELRQSITLSAPMTLTGIRPDGPLEVVACLPDQTVRRLLWIRNFRPEWNRVYYFREPLVLPKGTRILLYSAHGATLFVE